LEHVKGLYVIREEKMSTVSEKNNKRLNITLTGDDVDLMESLRSKLNDELAMKLSMAQVIRRLLKQATQSVNS